MATLIMGDKVGVVESLEAPAAAAFPEMADKALGVFLAALVASPVLGTWTVKDHPKQTSCPRPQNRAPEIRG